MQFVLLATVALFAILISLQLNRRAQHSQPGATSANLARLFRIVSLVAVLGAASQAITVVGSGTVGVLKIFGKVQPNILTEGINFRNPFFNVIIMNIESQELREEIQVATKENLTVGLDISVTFRINPKAAPDIVRSIGSNQAYIRKILLPSVQSVVPNVTIAYSALEIYYASSRNEVAATIEEEIQKATADRGAIIESVQIRDVILPAELSAAIEEKLRIDAQ